MLCYVMLCYVMLWCHPYFFPKKTDHLFSDITVSVSSPECHPYFSFKKTNCLFWIITVTLLFHLGCHTLGDVTPDLFKVSTVLCKFSHNFYSGVTPRRATSPGAVRPLVTPLVAGICVSLEASDHR